MRVIKYNHRTGIELVIGEVADNDFKAAGALVADDFYGKRRIATDSWEIKMETARDAFMDNDTWFGRGTNVYSVKR